MIDPLSPRQQELHDKLAALLAEYVDVIGPVEGDIDHSITAQEMAQLPHRTNVFLAEWVVCMGWQDFEQGDYFTSKINRHGMPPTHQAGLLQLWVNDLI